MASLLHQQLSRTAALRPVAGSAAAAHRSECLPAAAEELARMVAATAQRNKHGEYLSVRRWFEGHNGPAREAPLAASLGRLLANVPEAALDPAQWLFLDTETTGLAGGSGTYAFLVGLAWWDAGGLEVEQLFLRDYSEEHAVLEALAGKQTAFARTPKYRVESKKDKIFAAKYRKRLGWVPWIELLIGTYFALAVIYAIDNENYFTVPFLLLFVVGYWVTGLMSLLQGRFSGLSLSAETHTKPFPVGV